MEDIKISVANLKIIELQIQNFKSIAGRKVFKDLTNFNCIVGPNGCGKSNFMDALCFVLGEKTSKLRVKKLQDLIHGSTIGSPTVKTASVEATFRAVNKDTAEEEILLFTRIIKQSSCIFLFNNKNVSKEEYLSKLKEYGMNVEFPNFLIYQGSIAEIALQKPQELRRYFEYIAGSTNLVKQYDELTDESKTLRNESQRLQTEKNNMNKVIKNAMGTQDEYKIYLESKNQYDDKIRLKELICLFYLDKAIKSLTQKSELGEIHSSNLNKELEALKQDLLDKRRLQKDGSKEVAESDEKIQKTQAELNKMKLCVLKSKETLNNAAKKVEDCKQQIEKNNEDIRVSDKTIGVVLTKIRKAEDKQERCKISTISEEHKSQYRSLKQEAALIHGKTFNIHNEEREDQADNDIIDTLKNELKALESYIKISEAGKNNCLERITKLNEKLAEYHTSEEQMQIDGNILIDLNERIKSIEGRLIEEGDVQINIEEHKHDERRKNVLKELKHTFKGVFDRVSNCCNVNKKKYKIPLTKVIGMKHMNAIIVDTEITAQKCIKYLKMQKYPPETFLPISFVKIRAFKRIIETSKSSAVLLKNILIYDEKYDNIMSFICKGTYVCEDEHTLKALYEQKINVVNLEGSYYQSSGLISGGVTDLARKAHHWTTEDESVQQNRFAKLNEEHAMLKQQLVQINRHKGIAFDTKQVESIIRVIKEDVKENEKEVTNIDEKLTKQKDDLKKIMKQIDLFKTKVTNRETTLNEVNESISIIFKGFCINLEIENIAEFENMEQQKNDLDNELNQFQMELDYIKKFKETLKKHKMDLQKHLSEFEKQYEVAIKDQEISSKNLSSTSLTVEEVKKDRDSKLKKLQEADSIADKISKKHSDLLKSCESGQNAQIKLKNDITMHKKQFNTEFTHCIVDGIEIPLIESEGSQDTQVDHYSNVIIDYNQIPEKYCRFADIKDKNFRKVLDNLIEEINKLRLKAESGSRYLSKHGKGRNKYIESLREKFEAMEKQYEEAVERYHTVTQKIKILAQIRNDRLTNLLNCMKTLIKPMYSDLTGDTTGNVFLQFENTENPFEGGITYNIIVPEKTFMSLDSHSGGEITMAGILLLLTIQKYSRCPILILDEIDAPLDRMNAIKLFKYLGKISADLQIFLITHNTEVFAPVQLLIGFTKKCVQEIVLKSKVVMLSCESYQQVSTYGILNESDTSV